MSIKVATRGKLLSEVLLVELLLTLVRTLGIASDLLELLFVTWENFLLGLVLLVLVKELLLLLRLLVKLLLQIHRLNVSEVV